MNFKIYYQNCRGLKTKTLDFRLAVLENAYYLIVVTESWLNDSFSSNELFDDRYLVYRRDKDKLLTCKEDGGGVILAVLKKYQTSSIEICPTIYECIWIKLFMDNGSILMVSVVYLVPFIKFSEYESYLQTCSDIIDSHPNSKFLILGDFNLSSIKWGTTSNSNDNIVHPAGYEGRSA